MLKTLVERAGFAQLYESSRVRNEAGSSRAADELAAVPVEISHVDLETLHERPVQAELIDLLLLPSDDPRFMSCVLIHGMGGSGKTVTAVAAIKDTAIRRHYSFIYWLVVGTDAVITQRR